MSLSAEMEWLEEGLYAFLLTTPSQQTNPQYTTGQ